jgi:hypothetical protein
MRRANDFRSLWLLAEGPERVLRFLEAAGLDLKSSGLTLP